MKKSTYFFLWTTEFSKQTERTIFAIIGSKVFYFITMNRCSVMTKVLDNRTLIVLNVLEAWKKNFAFFFHSVYVYISDFNCKKREKVKELKV